MLSDAYFCPAQAQIQTENIHEVQKYTAGVANHSYSSTEPADQGVPAQ